MKQQRTFDLVNSKGKVYTLTPIKWHTGYFYDVSGLGTSHTAEYQRVGEMYDLLKDDINQGSISGAIFFMSKYPYQEYARFVEFCKESPLTLHYRTPAGEYMRDGNIVNIEKSETGGPMKVRVSFAATTLWYKRLYKTSGASQTTLSFESDSNIDCPCDLMFTPASARTGIYWTHTVNGTMVVEGGLQNISLSTSETVHIRTDTNPYKIYKAGTNLYPKSSFITKRFIHIQKGTNVITFDGSGGTITVEGRLYYETV